MYVGLIIVFTAFEDEKLKEYLIASLNTITNARICLVCNDNDEEVLEILSEIARDCANTNVVSTKRNKSTHSSIRAGARYLSNQLNLKHVGFIVDLDSFKIVEVVKEYIQHQKEIVTLHKIEQENKAFKPTFYQSLFPIPKYLEKIVSNPIA